MSDFQPLIIRKRGASRAASAAQRQGAQKKPSAGHNKAHQGTDHQLISKIDRENEVSPPTKISNDVGRAMQAARAEGGLSQKDLAHKVNEKQSVISEYESGSAIPNTQILAKLERVLSVKLRGSDIGMKLTKKTGQAAKPKPARGA